MKKIVCLITALCLFSACKTKTTFIPIESIKTEYKEKIFRDSIFVYDSVFMQVRSDTVWYEKYQTVYKDRRIKDSILIRDTIQIPYPIIETQVVNKVSSIQYFQIWCGRILLLILILYFGINYLKR